MFFWRTKRRLFLHGGDFIRQVKAKAQGKAWTNRSVAPRFKEALKMSRKMEAWNKVDSEISGALWSCMAGHTMKSGKRETNFDVCVRIMGSLFSIAGVDSIGDGYEDDSGWEMRQRKALPQFLRVLQHRLIIIVLFSLYQSDSTTYFHRLAN